MQKTTATVKLAKNVTVTTVTTLNNLNVNKQKTSFANVAIATAQQNAKNAMLYTHAQKQLALQLQNLAINALCLQQLHKQKQQVFITMRSKFICVKVNNATALMQQHATAFAQLVAYCNANNVTMLTTVNNSLLMRIAKTA